MIAEKEEANANLKRAESAAIAEDAEKDLGKLS